jgi:hypothetical protein
MANIAREGNEIVLKLSTGERKMAMHRDVRVSLAAVTSVDVVDEPIRRIQGLKPRNFKGFRRVLAGPVRVRVPSSTGPYAGCCSPP